MTRYFEVIDLQGKKHYFYGEGLKKFTNKILIALDSETRVSNIKNAIKELNNINYIVKEF